LRPFSRTLPAVLAMAGLFPLASCGGDGKPAPAANPATATVTAQATTPSTATAVKPPEGRGTVTPNADGTRTVTSAWGTVTVPAQPQRIVSVLGYIDFETMLALGVKPLAAGTQGGAVASRFAPHLAGRTDGIKPLPWADGAPAETIAALRPDLIFAPDEDSAKLLASIAPTVPGGAADAPQWKDDVRYIAAVLGRDADAARLIADYETRAASLRTRLTPVLAGKTVASPQVAFDHSQVYVDRPDSFSSVVLTELGFTLAPLVAKADAKKPLAISFERLPTIDADILFWQVRQRDENGQRDEAGLRVAKGNPLWGKIPAVAIGSVFEVDNRPWYFATILAAQHMLDDVERSLLR
jgi:iron complex transport system substrate-binding protein